MNLCLSNPSIIGLFLLLNRTVRSIQVVVYYSTVLRHHLTWIKTISKHELQMIDFLDIWTFLWFQNFYKDHMIYKWLFFKTDSLTILELEDCLLDDFGILGLRFQRHMILHLIKLSFEGIHRRLLNQSFNQVKNQYKNSKQSLHFK